LGLAPVTTDVTFQKIQEIHGMGTEILLVEQNVSRALTLVQRAYVLESGKVIMHGTSAELANNKQVQAAYLGSNANALPSNPDQFKSKFRWAIPVYYRRVVVAPERNHCHHSDRSLNCGSLKEFCGRPNEPHQLAAHGAPMTEPDRAIPNDEGGGVNHPECHPGPQGSELASERHGARNDGAHCKSSDQPWDEQVIDRSHLRGD
jgi:Branched-chain amino acid ATP-binding cassette transporter